MSPESTRVDRGMLSPSNPKVLASGVQLGKCNLRRFGRPNDVNLGVSDRMERKGLRSLAEPVWRGHTGMGGRRQE
jgi:hypothetical protein